MTVKEGFGYLSATIDARLRILGDGWIDAQDAAAAVAGKFAIDGSVRHHDVVVRELLARTGRSVR